jgi:hypothetical protein
LLRRYLPFIWPNIQAIINGYNDKSYKSIIDNTKAIIFLGTPHRGADYAGLLNGLLQVSFSSKDFVRQLRPNSELIQEVNNAFRDRSESLQLVSYYESTGMQGLGVYPNIT